MVAALGMTEVNATTIECTNTVAIDFAGGSRS